MFRKIGGNGQAVMVGMIVRFPKLFPVKTNGNKLHTFTIQDKRGCRWIFLKI